MIDTDLIAQETRDDLAFGEFVIRELGPLALSGEKMSIYDAAKTAWKHALIYRDKQPSEGLED